MKPLVECVPNFSEGRRQEVIDAIVEAMSRAGGVFLLDVSSDFDHNRSVVTLAGLPEEVEKAIFAGIRTAAELIDLNQHSGVHPRFGATDVVPFVPLRDVSMDDCVHLAHRLGRRVADELQIPVYFYEYAALRPDYEDLNNIRNAAFQYEQLREVIETDPMWMPDVGRAVIGSAGATLIGARMPLIILNVFLNTDNIEIARRIAKAIQYSEGGLRYVKSSSFLVNGRAQISLNLTNYQKTPIFRAVEFVRREAARYGVAIESSEIMGLVPEDALLDSAEWYLQLNGFKRDNRLEYRIAQAEAEPTQLSQEEPPIPEDATYHVVLPPTNEVRRPEQFAAAVAQPTATPAGGAVLAQVGALAAALAEMVAGLTVGKKSYASVQDQMTAIRSAAGKLREQLVAQVGADIDAIEDLMSALRLAKTHPDRENEIQQATLKAADVSLQAARLCYEALQLLVQVAEQGNHNAAIDAAVGAKMALTAIECAALNARANLLGLTDEDIVARYADDIKHLLELAPALTAKAVLVASERVGLTEVF